MHLVDRPITALDNSDGVLCLYYTVVNQYGEKRRRVKAFKHCGHWCAHASVNSRKQCCLCSTTKGPHWRQGPCYVCEAREQHPTERAGQGASG